MPKDFFRILNRFLFSFSLSLSLSFSTVLASAGGIATFSSDGFDRGLSLLLSDPNRRLFDLLNRSRPDGLVPLGWAVCDLSRALRLSSSAFEALLASNAALRSASCFL